MKNIFLALVIVAVILSVFPMAIHADEVTTPIEEVTTLEEVTTAEPITEPVEEPTEETPTETPTEAPTSTDDAEVVSLLDRLIEAWEKGEISTVVSLAFDIAMIVVLGILKKASKKDKIETIAELRTGNTTTVGAVNNLISAANDVVKAVEGEGGLKAIVENFKDGVNAQIEEIKNLDKEKLEQYGKDLANTSACIKLLAEMIQTTYANSTTISMPTKNMIAEKYVEICRKLDGEQNG